MIFEIPDKDIERLVATSIARTERLYTVMHNDWGTTHKKCFVMTDEAKTKAKALLVKEIQSMLKYEVRGDGLYIDFGIVYQTFDKPKFFTQTPAKKKEQKKS